MMYIGHTTLETFLAQVPPGQTLYLNLLEEHLPGQHGIGWVRSYLLLQTATPQTELAPLVHYWRMVLGEVLAPGGVPWEEPYAALSKAGLSARQALRQYLGTHPHVRQLEEGAVIAMPRALQFVAGGTDQLLFDNATGTFQLAALAPGQPEPNQELPSPEQARHTAGGPLH